MSSVLKKNFSEVFFERQLITLRCFYRKTLNFQNTFQMKDSQNEVDIDHLIYEYKKREFMWNSKHKDFRSVSKKTKAINDIADVLNCESK